LLDMEVDRDQLAAWVAANLQGIGIHRELLAVMTSDGERRFDLVQGAHASNVPRPWPIPRRRVRLPRLPRAADFTACLRASSQPGWNFSHPRDVPEVMRQLIITIALASVLLGARRSEACVQLQEANKLLGWSADGKLALHVRLDANGALEHAEILPTRFEGWKYIVFDQGGITVKRVELGKCDVRAAPDLVRVPGKLTMEALVKLDVVKAMHLVPVPTDDGAKLTAGFVPAKRYAEHEVELRHGGTVVATLPVPVWCLGSCLRDEDWRKWGAKVRTVAKVGDRTLYVIRMMRVCNGGNDKDMWIDRVIATPGTAAPPARRCRGSGE
jgi:hypothetical protein